MLKNANKFGKVYRKQLLGQLDRLKSTYITNRASMYPTLYRTISGRLDCRGWRECAIFHFLDVLNCAGETEIDRSELRKRLIWSVGGKAAFDELVSSGWKFEEHPLLKPLTPEEIVDLITAQRVRARKIFDERKVKITVFRGGEHVEIYAIKVTEISTCDCTYCSSVT